LRHNRVSKLSDFCFECIASVEKHHVIALRDECVHFLWFQVNATTYDSVFVNNNFVGNTEGDNFVANFYLQVGEVIFTSIRPFEFHGFKRWVTFRHPDVFLHLVNGSANSAINPVLRDENPSVQSEAFA